jgi:hypothetical protein
MIGRPSEILIGACVWSCNSRTKLHPSPKTTPFPFCFTPDTTAASFGIGGGVINFTGGKERMITPRGGCGAVRYLWI